MKEAEEEARSWNTKHEEGVEDALPILTGQKWKAQTKRRREEEVHEEEGTEETEEKAPSEETYSLEEVKQMLAENAMAIQESPEEEFKKRYRVIRECLVSGRREVREVAALTAALLLIDLMPGYPIRPLSEAEQAASVSKEVKAVRDYEQAYLQAYRHFISLFNKWLNSNMHRVAMAIAAKLVTAASHFNLYEQGIIKPLVKLVMAGDAQAESLLSQAISDDVHGQVTCWIVRSLSEAIAANYQRVKPACLLLLRNVRIHEVKKTSTLHKDLQLAPSARLKPPKKLSLMSKREKKEWRAKLQDAQRLAQAEGTYSLAERQRWADDTIRHLFRIIFGALKSGSIPLLPLILECLSKHARHLNEAYLADLLSLLRSIQQQALSFETSAHLCLAMASLQTIHEQANTLQQQSDLSNVYRYLFSLMRRASTPADLELLGKCWNVLMVKRRVSPLRLAAFAQRLADQALSCQSQQQWWLTLLLELLNAHSSLHTLLDGETVGQGYRADVDDPDLVNPYARSLMDVIGKIRGHSDLIKKIRALQPK